MRMMERFWSKVAKQEDGCWLWTADKSHGYGRFRAWGKRCQAHRFSYEVHRGPIPPYTPTGYQLDHIKCNNRACVNPEHMRLVPQRENNARRIREMTHCKRGHEFSPENLCTYLGQRICLLCVKERRKQEHIIAQRRAYDMEYKQRDYVKAKHREEERLRSQRKQASLMSAQAQSNSLARKEG